MFQPCFQLKFNLNFLNQFSDFQEKNHNLIPNFKQRYIGNFM